MSDISYDGLKILIDVLENDGGLVNHLVKNTLFFHPGIVQRQAACMLAAVQRGERLPVRFSTKDVYYADKGCKGQPLHLSNRSAAAERSKTDNIYTSVRSGVRIEIDWDGNKSVRSVIKGCTGEIVGEGARNTIRNYMISHIWGKTDNPFFFTALWNIALTPQHCSFILDKPDDKYRQISDIKGLFKAICWELYHPNELMKEKDLLKKKPDEQMLEKARCFIGQKQLTFIPAIPSRSGFPGSDDGGPEVRVRCPFWDYSKYCGYLSKCP